MRITDALLGEHEAFQIHFDELTAAAEAALGDVPALTRQLAARLAAHDDTEEETLFMALQSRLGPQSPLALMEMEHLRIGDLIEDVLAADEPAQLRHRVAALIDFMNDHFAKEEAVLFTLAEQFMDDGELERLGAAWSRRRRLQRAAA